MGDDVPSIENDSIQALQEIAYKNAEDLRMQCIEQNAENQETNSQDKNINGITNGESDKITNTSADNNCDDPSNKEADETSNKEADEPSNKEADEPSNKEADEPTKNNSDENISEKETKISSENKTSLSHNVENDTKSEDNKDSNILVNESKSNESADTSKPCNGITTSEEDKINTISDVDEITSNKEDNTKISNKEDNEAEEEEDDDFNPLLFCPEVSMNVEESTVLTAGTDQSSTDDSNSLFTPLFSTYVDEMTGAEVSFNLTNAEKLLRERLYGRNTLPIQNGRIHCTACNVHLGSALIGQNNRFVHPLLKVLICKECYHFYTSGEFERDEDGSELYCRWCGQGGQVLCCSKCEFVFCKKCIRINFGRKKVTEVRDSEEWNCFRCDMTQIELQRIMCFEFFEYIKKEMGRVTPLQDVDFMNKDFSSCCTPTSKKRAEPENEEISEKRTKRKKTDVDPDYNPRTDMEPAPSLQNTSNSSPMLKNVLTDKETKIPNVLHKTGTAVASVPTTTIKFVNQSHNPTIRIAGSLIGGTVVGGMVRAPGLQFIRTPNQSINVRPPTIVVRPRQVAPAKVVAFSPNQSVTTTQLKNPPNAPATNAQTPIKHEWFEKTVRSAARVNSNLSYTLSQLNKAQAAASSVEQLAVVHNKLQEVLSSSINSLIQIRKSLRTEFIAGIKTIRFPPKPLAEPKPIDPNDDDCIIVTPSVSAVNKTNKNPPKSTPTAVKANHNVPVLSQITVKKSLKPATPNNTSKILVGSKSLINKRISTGSNISVNGGGYLKVRSFSQLQTLTPECITIPDDESKDAGGEDEPILINPPSNTLEEKDPLANDSDEENKVDKEKQITVNKNKNKSQPIVQSDVMKTSCVKGSKSNEEVTIKEEPEDINYNVKETNPSPVIRRMLSVKVNLKKTPAIENLVKKEPLETKE